MSKRIFKKCKKKNVYQQRERESIKLFLHPTISKLEDLLNCQVAVREPKKWVSFCKRNCRNSLNSFSVHDRMYFADYTERIQQKSQQMLIQAEK